MYNQRDSYHGTAEKIWGTLLETRPFLYTSNLIVSETITLLRNRSGVEESIRFGDALFSSTIVRIYYVEKPHELKAWYIFKKYSDQNFSFADCASFALMQELGISKAFTFDRHFSVLGFEILQ